jgi:hypothetical protein
MPVKALHVVAVILGVIGVGYMAKKRYQAFVEGVDFEPDFQPKTYMNSSTVLNEDDMQSEAYMKPYIAQSLDDVGAFMLMHQAGDGCWLCQQGVDLVGIGSGASHAIMTDVEGVIHHNVVKTSPPESD